MSFIVGSKTVFPKFKYSQNQMQDFLSTVWQGQEKSVQKFHESVQVQERAICIPFDEVTKLGGFAQRNKIWKEKAVELSKEAIHKVLSEFQVAPHEINYLVTTSVTGFSIPSLDAHLMNEIEFSPQIKRLPLFGFGCLGGVSSLNRAADYLKIYPNDLALVVGVELCSLTFQMQDLSIPNLVGTALFADGAAAVLLAGANHPLAKKAQLEILSYESFFYPNTQNTMGWNIRDTGFQLVLSGDVAEVVKANIPANYQYFLDKNKVELKNMKFVISHPGGPKVLDAMAESLQLPATEFKHSWDSLREHGNMSSVSILNVLEKTLENNNAKSGDLGAMAAMGPAFNCEITLVKKVC